METKVVDSLDGIDAENIFGVFKNKRSIRDTLSNFADKYLLCKKLLGVENSKRSCFGYKLRKCKGACTGKEAPARYNARFLIAFIENKQFRAWPFEKSVEIVEKDEVEEVWESFTVDNWSLVAKKNSRGEEEKYKPGFDPDHYRIFSHFLKHHKSYYDIK